MTVVLPFRQIDAFAERPYRGNPAGAVLNADRLTDAQMQLMAREVNVSETAFVSRLNDLHRPPLLRWFTPAAEVEFCGHATLAAAHALYETGHLTRIFTQREPQLVFESAAGELRLTPELLPEPHGGPLWWLAMPAPTLKPDNTNPVRTCELLGISDSQLDVAFPPMRTRDDDVIYFIESCPALFEMQPRFEELGAWCRQRGIRGICVATTATLSDSIDVQSRFFAPAVGVNEDPVTGSVHGPLAALLVIHGVVGSASGKSGLTCIQGRPGDRTGLVRALVTATPRGYQVKIGGLCCTTIVGEMAVPPAEPG